jgi:hypothetical protein
MSYKLKKNLLLEKLREKSLQLELLLDETISEGEFAGLIKYGLNGSKYNFKKYQILSSAAIIAKKYNNRTLELNIKKQILHMLKFQCDDGFFYTDKYEKDFAKANNQFLGIELMNAYIILESSFSSTEKEFFREKIKKTINYVLSYINPLSESNQISGAILFLKLYSEVFNEKIPEYDFLLDVLLKQQKKDGSWVEKWEAPSVDYTYLSLMLAYLSRLSDFDNSPRLKLAVDNCNKYFLNFILPSGEMDISGSKRWIPLAPYGKKFVVYAFSKYNFSLFAKYIDKVFENVDYEDLFYCFISLEYFSEEVKTPHLSNFNSKDLIIHTINDKRLSFGLGPIRVSGGQICSFYDVKKGWIIQQPVIGKNTLPSKCTQIRILLEDGTILNSSLDYYALFSNLRVVGTLREENEKLFNFPFGSYNIFNSSSDVLFTQDYSLNDTELKIDIEIFFKKSLSIKNIFFVIPIINGILKNHTSREEKEVSPYGEVNVCYVSLAENINVSKKQLIKETVTISLGN